VLFWASAIIMFLPKQVSERRRAALLLVLLLLWYATSAACTTSSKRLLALLKPAHCALQLTCAQFAAALALSAVPCALQRAPPVLPRRILAHVAAISLSYTAGFALLNLSLLHVSAAFAETLRGLEPLFTAAIACAFDVRGGSMGRGSALALAVLVAGGGVSFWAQPPGSAGRRLYVGASLALGANLAFAARGAFTTAAQDELARHWEAPVNANALFLYQHACGFLVTLVLSVAVGGGAPVAQFVSGGATQPRALLVASTLSFFLYNRLSLAVLLRLDLVTHSVLTHIFIDLPV